MRRTRESLGTLALIAALLAATSAVVSVTAASGAELPAKSRIEAVTVYPDGAVVRRVAEQEIPAGSSRLVLSGLPQALDPASLQVTGEAEGRLAIGSVEARVTPAETGRPGTGNAERLKAARAELARITGEIDAAEGKKRMIDRFARFGAREDDDEDKAPPLGLDQWQDAWDLVGRGFARVNEDLRRLRADEARVQEEIAALEAVGSERPARPTRDVVVDLEAPAPVKGRIVVSYRVAGAGWRPVYDASVRTEGTAASLTLERRAIVAQRTGEPWENVALTLSTVRVSRGSRAPGLPGEKLTLLDPAIVLRDDARRRSFEANRVQEEAARLAPAAPALAAAAPKLEEAERISASVDAGAFQAEYAVPGQVTVTSDGAERNLILGSMPIEATLRVRTTPVLDQTAYLEAEFEHQEEAPLLPGVVMLRRDGTFIGRDTLALTPTGEKVTLGFGADERVKVTRNPVRRRESESGVFGSSRRDERVFRTVVKNLHGFPIKVIVVDRLPFSEDAAVTVETLPGSTPPTESNLQDKRGVFAWVADLKPQESREFRLAYRIRWPADKRLRPVPEN